MRVRQTGQPLFSPGIHFGGIPSISSNPSDRPSGGVVPKAEAPRATAARSPLPLATLTLCLGLAALCSTGCQSAPTAAQLQSTAAATTQASSTLAAGDIVSISFTGAPELNQAQKVRADGRISLPLVGEVEAAGKSLTRLQTDLARLYQPQLQNTTVLVGLEASAAAVYVSGAVNGPRKVPLDRPLSAFEAIMEAGGFTPGLGNPKKVLLIRQDKGQYRTQMLDLSPALRNETSEAFYLQPYDVLIVQEKML